MKKLILSLVAVLLVPLTLQAGGSSFEVVQVEDSTIDVYSTGSFSTITEFSIDSYPQVQSDLGIKKLDIECYGAEGIEEAKLMKGNQVISHKTNIEEGNGSQSLVFLMVDNVVPYGVTTDYRVKVKMSDDAPNQRFACSIFDLRLYDKGSNGSYDAGEDIVYDHTSMITDFSVKNVVKGHAKYDVYPSYDGFERDTTSYHAYPDKRNNWLAGAQVEAKEGLTIDKVFVSCSDARSIEQVNLDTDDDSWVSPRYTYTDTIVYETSDKGKMYVFTDLDMELDEDEFITMLGDTNNEPDRGANSQGCEIIDYELVSVNSDNSNSDSGANDSSDDNNPNTDDDAQDNDSGMVLPPAGYEDEVLTAYDVNPFPDTNLDDLEGRAAAELYRRAVLGGYPDGEFKGDREVNRAEASKFLLLARFGSIDLDKKNNGKFKDVLEGQWYVPYVIYAAEKSILQGYADGNFKPEQSVNTVEFLKLLTKTFDLELNVEYDFDDVDSSVWFAKYAGSATKYNLFPKRGTHLDGASMLTRDEVAVAIYQFLKNR